MSEHHLQDTIFDELVYCRCLVIRVNSGARGVIKFAWWAMLGITRQSRGVSDLIGITPKGRFFAIECKDGSNKPSPEQLEFLSGVNERGGIGIVAYSIRDIDALLQAIDTAPEAR